MERLAQLLLSVPDASRDVLRQLLSNVRLASGDGSSAAAGFGSSSGSGQLQQQGACSRLSDAGGSERAAAGSNDGQQRQQQAAALQSFSNEDVAHFQAGLQQCLAGVLQIKVGLQLRAMLQALQQHRRMFN